MADVNSRKLIDHVARWETIFELISMDSVDEFLPAMGLQLKRVDELRTEAREFLKSAERAGSDIRLEHQILQDTLERISAEAGTDEFEVFRQWSENEFPFGESGAEMSFHWQMMLWWLAGVGGRNYPPRQPPLGTEKIKAIVKAVREEFSGIDEMWKRLEEAESAPKSDWDSHVLSKFEEGFNPFQTVDHAVQVHWLRQVWQKLKSELSVDEIELLTQWARRESHHLQIPPDLLVSPTQSS